MSLNLAATPSWPGAMAQACVREKIDCRSRRGPKGDRGAPGPRGHRGDRGAAEQPVTIRSWLVDPERYRASPLLSNGQVGAMLELRPLFELFQKQTSP